MTTQPTMLDDEGTPIEGTLARDIWAQRRLWQKPRKLETRSRAWVTRLSKLPALSWFTHRELFLKLSDLKIVAMKCMEPHVVCLECGSHSQGECPYCRCGLLTRFDVKKGELTRAQQHYLESAFGIAASEFSRARASAEITLAKADAECPRTDAALVDKLAAEVMNPF